MGRNPNIPKGSFGSVWWNPETRRYPLMVVTGLAWALAYPTPGIAGVAWLVPGLLLFGSAGLPWAGAFRCGFVAGLVHFLVSLRWLLHMPFPAGAAAGWLVLAGYLACYPALWSACCGAFLGAPDRDRDRASGDPTRCGSASGPAPLTPLSGRWAAVTPTGAWPGGATGPWRQTLWAHAGRPWARRVFLPMAAAALWVGLEMVQARFLTGFPWNFLGASQWHQLPLIQVAAVTGVYGVSFLVCWASVALIGGCLIAALRPENRWLWLAEARLPLLAVLVSIGIGFYGIMGDRRAAALTPPATIRLALIQPAIPQTLQWDEAEGERSFRVAEELTRQALVLRPDVLVWPEGSFGLTSTNYARIVAQLAPAGCEWVFSETDIDDRGPVRRAYNAAFLAGTEGRVRTVYRKRRLVLFGEYVPFEKWLPFLKWFTPIGSSFASGERPVPMKLGGDRAVASPVICFEDTFPHGVREHAGPGIDFLLGLTNDGWFGESGAQWQHAANSAFRAVENGLPVVRCTNNGLTCWFDAQGGLREVLGGGGATVYGRGFLMVDIPVGGVRKATFYQRRGDVFGWLCAAYAGWSLWRVRFGRRPASSFSGD